MFRFQEWSKLPQFTIKGLLAIAMWFALFSPVQSAQVVTTVGSLHIERSSEIIPAKPGTRLQEGDTLVSLPGAEALLKFDDGARLAVRNDSALHFRDLELSGPIGQRKMTVRIVQGAMRYISAKAGKRYVTKFETKTATIGLRGTDIEIALSLEPLDDNVAGTYLKVNSGAATLQAMDGTLVDVDSGQIAFGGEPELVPRGIGGSRRMAARKLESVSGLFKAGLLDKLMKTK